MTFMNIVRSDCVGFHQPYMTIYHVFCYIWLHYPSAITPFPCLHEVFELLIHRIFTGTILFHKYAYSPSPPQTSTQKPL